MDFQNALFFLIVRNHNNVRFLPNTNLIADGVDAFVLLVCIEGEVVETSVGESVPVIFETNKSACLVFQPADSNRPHANKSRIRESNHTLCIFHLRDQVRFGQRRNRPVYSATTSKTGNLHNQGCRHHFMIPTSQFHLIISFVSCQMARCD